MGSARAYHLSDSRAKKQEKRTSLMDTTLKEMIRPLVPKQVLEMKRRLYFYFIDETRSVPLDVLRLDPRIPFAHLARKRLADQMELAHRGINWCAHTHSEIVTVVSQILRAPQSIAGVILEAGCFKGGSTAKLSLAAQLSGRKLLVFDSFEGLPVVAEQEKHNFSKGDYEGRLEEVQKNVRTYGAIEACEFFRGWFEQTLPSLAEPVAVAFVDVDLRDSLKTCLSYIYPKLVPGGSIFSHDGHLPQCVELMRNEEFWHNLGGPAPQFKGLGTRKLVRIRKPLRADA
jgi:O-methyltransferase